MSNEWKALALETARKLAQRQQELHEAKHKLETPFEDCPQFQCFTVNALLEQFPEKTWAMKRPA